MSIINRNSLKALCFSNALIIQCYRLQNVIKCYRLQNVTILNRNNFLIKKTLKEVQYLLMIPSFR